MELELTEDEKRVLLNVARNSIKNQFKETDLNFETTPTLNKHYGAFVTLHKNDVLRGCIGYITAQGTLIETVIDAAKASAFRDTRFPSLSREELDQIEIEISVLSPLRRIDSIEEIEVGKHGILIRRNFQSGLLLPQVAIEHDWSREVFLINTCYKAGLGGDCWKMPDTEIEIFNAIVFNEKELGSEGHP